MKRFAVLTLSLLLLVIVSLGSSVAAKKVEITFWHAMGAQLGDTLESLVSEFNAQSPDVFVRAEYQGNYGALSQKLVGALVARKPPTMAQVYGNWAAEYIDGNELVPVEKFVYGPNGLSTLEIEDIWDGLRAGCMFDGVWYTMPFNKSVYVLVYNKDAFDEAGIANPPATWQELLEAAERLTIRDGDKIVRYGIGLRPNVDIFACFFFNSGGEWLDAAGKVNVNGLPASGAAVHDGPAPQVQVACTLPGYLDADFGAERVAMYSPRPPAGLHGESVAGKFNWTAAPLPYADPAFKSTLWPALTWPSSPGQPGRTGSS